MKVAVIVVAVLAVLGVGGFLLAHNSKDKTSNTTTSTSTKKSTDDMSNMSSTSSPAGESSSATAATDSVQISNFAFSPAKITVKKGTTVTWTNKDSTTHTVTENDGQSGPNSGPLQNSKSYSFTFSTAGTFKYICSIHPSMAGEVVVTE